MTVGFMRWLQRNPGRRWSGGIAVPGNDVIALLLCKEFALVRGELATTALRVEHQQMIIEPTYCTLSRTEAR